MAQFRIGQDATETLCIIFNAEIWHWIPEYKGTIFLFPREDDPDLQMAHTLLILADVDCRLEWNVLWNRWGLQLIDEAKDKNYYYLQSLVDERKAQDANSTLSVRDYKPAAAHQS